MSGYRFGCTKPNKIDNTAAGSLKGVVLPLVSNSVPGKASSNLKVFPLQMKEYTVRGLKRHICERVIV